MKNKYYATRKVEFEDMIFDSQPECLRYQVLREAQERGLISDLQTQRVFTILPRQTESVEVKLKTKTKVVEEFREHPVTYAADFVYVRDGKEVVEDVKGAWVTEDYILKRKMMRYFGHPIKEVRNPADDFPDIAFELGIRATPPKKKSKKSKTKKTNPDDEWGGLFD